MYGVVAQACHHFGWTLDYILNEIDWRVLQRMLIDSPKVEYLDGNEPKKKTKDELRLTPETSEEFLEKLKQIKK